MVSAIEGVDSGHETWSEWSGGLQLQSDHGPDLGRVSYVGGIHITLIGCGSGFR